MSTRPVAASICGVNEVATPPCRMNVPSCTVRTRRIFGLKVIVRVITDRRDELLIETGTVYGPPATWNVVPGTVRMICAGVCGGAPGGAVGVTSVSLGCADGAAPAGAPPTGAPVVAGGTPGGTTPAGGCIAGGAPVGGAATGGAGFSGTGAIGVGTADVA